MFPPSDNRLGRPLARLLASLAGIIVCGAARADDTGNVGVLHSFSGTVAISESTLQVAILMMLAEQNKHGGQLGNKIEPVVVDPASNWPRFAEKTVELLEKDKVAVVFGRSTSASRKSALPVFKKDDGLLFSPVQYGVRNPQRTYLRGTGSQSAGDSRRRNMSDEVMRIAAAFWAVRS